MIPAGRYWRYLSINCFALQSPQFPEGQAALRHHTYVLIGIMIRKPGTSQHYADQFCMCSFGLWVCICECTYAHVRLCVFLLCVRVITLRERTGQICMEVINGIALQQHAGWWANFILQYSSDSKCNVNLISVVRRCIWIIWIWNLLRVERKCEQAFIYLFCFVNGCLLEQEKVPSVYFLKPSNQISQN